MAGTPGSRAISGHGIGNCASPTPWGAQPRAPPVVGIAESRTSGQEAAEA